MWGNMQDPTRIDSALDALRAAWEGQPELNLVTLFEIARNRGAGWNANDEDVTRILREMARVHPPQLPLTPERAIQAHERWLAVTEEPKQRVTLDTSGVIVRAQRDDGSLRQAVSWDYSAIRPTGPGRPLVVADTAGNEHRLGIVRYFALLADADLNDLSGISRRGLGERVYLVRGKDADGWDVTVLIDHGLHVTTKHNRALEQINYAWERIEKCRPGAELAVQLPGGRSIELCTVTEIRLAESESQLDVF